MRVLNARQVGCKSTKTATYVGRPSKWGNPFLIGRDGPRDEVIERYRLYLSQNDDLMAQIVELRGRDLVCWCAPHRCHADILLELANAPSSNGSRKPASQVGNARFDSGRGDQHPAPRGFLRGRERR